VELTDHHRWIYHDRSIGGDDPGTGFDDYLATISSSSPVAPASVAVAADSWKDALTSAGAVA